jgi:hypothetical protein
VGVFGGGESIPGIFLVGEVMFKNVMACKSYCLLRVVFIGIWVRVGVLGRSDVSHEYKETICAIDAWLLTDMK